ncbi:MAG: glycosyltransferase family 4 protein [Christensenellales bacterium]
MIKNKKILVVTTTDNMIWQFLIPHIQFLQQYNEVECVCAKTGFWFDELKDKYHLTMHEINFARNPFKPRNIKAYKALCKLQKENGFDLIYSQQPVGGLMGRLLAKKFKIPCFYTAHGFAFLKGGSKIKNFVFRNVEKYLAKYTDVLITINDEDFYACKDWKAKKKYKISGIGVDNKKIDNAKPREQARNNLDLKDDEVVVLTVAEFTKNKNYPTMLKAIEKLKDKNIKYLICGTGSEMENMKEYAHNIGLDDKVKFLGYVKNVGDIMSASDVFFLASHREGLALSVIESMNFGLPIVGSNVRGIRDLIEDGKNGFVCEKDDVDGFADRLGRLCDDKELRNKMGKESLKMSQKYSIDNVKSELEQIYNEFEN